MLNQSFTADNFRKIFDYENRKGMYLEGKFFPEIEEITKSLKECSKDFRELYKTKEILQTEEYETQKSILNTKKQFFKNKKEKLLTEELEKISREITSSGFKIKLKEISSPTGKKVYTIENNPRSYFAIKQIQYNIKKLYKVKQSNRYEIICQLKDILSDKFPKYVIRTDIKSFYETISRDNLLKKINEEPLLTLSSKKIIRQILKDYEDVSGNANGIPRGVGVSAYLSELYMRDFDKKIQADPEVIFYARYVDDIVVVFAPKPNSTTDRFLPFLESAASEIKLGLNADKTEPFDLLKPKNCVLEYLGYKIAFGTSGSNLNISNKKLLKYTKRIELTFKDYANSLNEKKARKLLVSRVKFLTGNTRLLNNKKNALIGIYFSNSLISDTSSLKKLDDLLSSKIDTLESSRLKYRLKKMSFQEGFSQKRFSHFSTVKLSKIVEVWKYAA